MRVLITGGHGYIGGHLTLALARDAAFSVTVTSRIRRKAVAGVKEVVLDLMDPPSQAALFRGQDCVVHLAAMNELECESDPKKGLNINGIGTFNLVAAAQAAGVDRFVYLSTYKVFGRNPVGLIEEKNVPRPDSHYSISHHVAEDYVLARNVGVDMRGVVLRLSNALGPSANLDADVWKLIASGMCRQAVEFNKISLQSDGSAWRNFIAMDDVISAIRHAMTISASSLDDGLFHVGGPGTLTVGDLAELISFRAQQILKKPIPVVRGKAKNVVNPQKLDWRIEKMRKTGWTPQVPIINAIDATLADCMDRAEQES